MRAAARLFASSERCSRASRASSLISRPVLYLPHFSSSASASTDSPSGRPTMNVSRLSMNIRPPRALVLPLTASASLTARRSCTLSSMQKGVDCSHIIERKYFCCSSLAV